MLRYALYARKSTESDERQAQSIEDQNRLADRYAKTYGYQIIETLAESRSAKEPGRAEFNRMIALIDKGKIDGIIAWHPDRLARNEMDAAAITMRVRKGIIKDLQFANYFFHNSPEGMMMLQMALSQSQYFSSKLALDVKRGMQSKLEKGWLPHRAMAGYLNDTHLEKGQKTISLDPERAPLIRRLFEHFLTGGYTGPQLLALLNDTWGYRSPKRRKVGGSPMALSTLYRVLGSPFYAGLIEKDGRLLPGKQPALITLSEHTRAKELLGQLTRSQPKRRTFAYTGFIRCAQCSCLITAQVTKNRYGDEYVYYRCGDCRGQVVSENKLQSQLLTEAQRLSVPPEFMAWAKEEWEKGAKRREAESPVVAEQRRQSIASLDAQLDSLLGALTKGLITDDEFSSRRERLLEERKRLSIQEEERTAREETARQTMENLARFLANVQGWIAEGDELTRKAAAGALGSNFFLDGKSLLWEPHPLLAGMREEQDSPDAKNGRIKPVETGSETQKIQPVSAAFPAWSCNWGLNQTFAWEQGITFPDLRDLPSRPC